MRFLVRLAISVIIIHSYDCQHGLCDRVAVHSEDSPMFFGESYKYLDSTSQDTLEKLKIKEADEDIDDGKHGDGEDGEDDDGLDIAEVMEVMKKRNQVVSCKEGYALLSCGVVQKHFTTTQHDPLLIGAYTHPIDTTTCACFASQSSLLTGPRCQAVCLKTSLHTTPHHTDVNTTIIIVATNHLLFTSIWAKCPEGTKVVGCHMQLSGKRAFKRFFVPLEDGTGCFCKDSGGGKCIATCASNLKEVAIMTSLPGDTMAECPARHYATGCGVKQGIECKGGYPSAYVSSPSSCSCNYPPSPSSLQSLSSPPPSSSSSSSSLCYSVCIRKSDFVY